MMKEIKIPKGCLIAFCVLVLAAHFINACTGFYIPFIGGKEGAVLLQFILPPLLLALNSLNAFNLYRRKTPASLRWMALMIKLITDLLLFANLLFFIFGVLLMGVFLTTFIGPLFLIGAGMVSMVFWWYSSLCCLSASTYIIAYIWQAVRENRMSKSMAILHTILQIFPFISFIDAIVVFRVTRESRS